MIALVAHGSSTLSAYTEAVRELACEILELIAEGLGVPDTWIFSRFIRDVDRKCSKENASIILP